MLSSTIPRIHHGWPSVTLLPYCTYVEHLKLRAAVCIVCDIYWHNTHYSYMPYVMGQELVLCSVIILSFFKECCTAWMWIWLLTFCFFARTILARILWSRSSPQSALSTVDGNAFYVVIAGTHVNNTVTHYQTSLRLSNSCRLSLSMLASVTHKITKTPDSYRCGHSPAVPRGST